MKLSYYMRGLGTGIVVTALIMGIATRNTTPPALTEAEIRAAAEKLGMVESSSLKLSDIPSSAGSQTPAENMDGKGGENAGNEETPDGTPGPGDAGNDETLDGTPEPGDAGGDGASEPGNAGNDEAPGPENNGSDGRTEGASESGNLGNDEMPDGTPGPGNNGSGGRTEGASESGDAGNDETPGPGNNGSDGRAEGTPGPGNNGNDGRPEGAPEPGNAGNDETPEPEGATTYTVTVKAGSGSRAVCNQLKEQGLIEDAGEFDQYLINNGYSKRISVGTYEIEAGADWERIAKIITKTR